MAWRMDKQKPQKSRLSHEDERDMNGFWGAFTPQIGPQTTKMGVRDGTRS